MRNDSRSDIIEQLESRSSFECERLMIFCRSHRNSTQGRKQCSIAWPTLDRRALLLRDMGP